MSGGVALWLRPYMAMPTALAAMKSGKGVTVTDTSDSIAFMPASPPHVGLIFYPGAKVEPAAYAVYMRAFAEHGYAAFIVKMPLNLAIFGENKASAVIAAYPHISTWVIGGHSLGGVFACSFADKHSTIKGLLLYASYPSSDMSSQTRLHVVSLSGSNDGLATPAKVNAAKNLLPPTTQYIVIQGGIHGFFGDYGVQDGDGQPSITREEARAEIITASLALLASVSQEASSRVR